MDVFIRNGNIDDGKKSIQMFDQYLQLVESCDRMAPSAHYHKALTTLLVEEKVNEEVASHAIAETRLKLALDEAHRHYVAGQNAEKDTLRFFGQNHCDSERIIYKVLMDNNKLQTSNCAATSDGTTEDSLSCKAHKSNCPISLQIIDKSESLKARARFIRMCDVSSRFSKTQRKDSTLATSKNNTRMYSEKHFHKEATRVCQRHYYVQNKLVCADLKFETRIIGSYAPRSHL
jgi:hypothetical protein